MGDISYMKEEFFIFHVWNMGAYFIHECQISYISCMKIWRHISHMKEEYSIFNVWKYGSTFHTWKKNFLYFMYGNMGTYFIMKVDFLFFMYENKGAYFIHERRISYMSCMKILGHISYMKVEFPIIHVWKYWVYTFIEWTPLLLFFKEENPHFPITYNDTITTFYW